MIFSLTLFFLVLSTEVKAQLKKINLFNRQQGLLKDTTEIQIQNYESTDWQKIDINFLTSYYEQDGNNSPVTGGIGTEALTDFTQKIILNVPVNKKLSINADAGYDYYTSASTDNIDNIQSSASSADLRGHGNLGFTYQIDDQKSFSLRAGGSGEYDYTSVSGGMNFNYLSKDKNTQIGFGVQAFIDQWSIIYPVELRGEGPLVPTNKRNSFNAALNVSQVINKRVQIGLMLEATLMDGLLSTPFHRVYFANTARAKVEQLPSQRLKIPIGMRANVFLSEKVLLRSYYRYYWDDWGVVANTASLEIPIKVNRFFSIYPFYRFHQQRGSQYFEGYKVHDPASEFYTSDYDLATLQSHAFGLGISYTPVNGIFKIKTPFKKKRPYFQLSSLDLKLSHYERSTGLKSNIVSFGMGFKF